MPTFVLALQVKSPDIFEEAARGKSAVVARTENDKVLLDPRTVLQDDLFLQVLRQALDAYR